MELQQGAIFPLRREGGRQAPGFPSGAHLYTAALDTWRAPRGMFTSGGLSTSGDTHETLVAMVMYAPKSAGCSWNTSISAKHLVEVIIHFVTLNFALLSVVRKSLIGNACVINYVMFNIPSVAEAPLSTNTKP